MTSVLTYDDRYHGFYPAWDFHCGDTVVLKGLKTTGMWWWKKYFDVWVVKIVKKETEIIGGNIDIDIFWRAVRTFKVKDDAEKFANEIGQLI